LAFPAVNPKTRYFAKGQKKKEGLNKTEEAYQKYLDLLQKTGEVLWFKYEGLKLRLADNTFYTPDFAVMAADGTLECHEVKGNFWTDDARVKIKVAASLYPFRFLSARKVKGGKWEFETF